MPSSFERYIAACNAALASGAAAEKTFRPFLIELLNSFNSERGGVLILDEGKKFKRGYPDIHLRKGSFLTGACETKDVGASLGNYISRDTQHQYNLEDRSSYLLTNYCEFYIFFDHSQEPYYHGSPFLLSEGRLTSNQGELSQFSSAIEVFIRREQGELSSLSDIINSIAILAASIQAALERMLELEQSEFLAHSFEALQQVLVFGLSKTGYADLLAQIITYREVIHWIASASSSPNGSINLRGSRLLDGLFSQLPSCPEVWGVIEPLIESISRTLRDNNLVRDRLLSASDDDQDLVYAFYEDFLARYSPAVRSRYGVYYTPGEVCKCMVSIVDSLLAGSLQVTHGIIGTIEDAEGSIKIIDPACGTGKFIREIYRLSLAKLSSVFSEPSRAFKESVLKSIFGFEILVAPYSISHYLLVSLLSRLGVSLAPEEDIPIFLTNSLEGSITTPASFAFAGWLNNESRLAYDIKNRNDLYVIIGNPPYQGESINLGDEARSLVSRYKLFRGSALREGGTLQLQRNIENDYCKFIGLAQRLLTRGEGILAYVLPNTFLTATSYRGLRESLLETFNEIFIINLHGYMRASRTTDDENIFPNVRDGICLFWGVRKNGSSDGSATRVSYWSVYGRRMLKLRMLGSISSIDDINGLLGEGKTFIPREEYPASDIFIPATSSTSSLYHGFKCLDGDIFGDRRGAIVTGRDTFAIHPSREVLHQRIRRLKECDLSDLHNVTAEIGANIRGDWTLRRAQQVKIVLQSLDDADINSLIRPILYRPFCFYYVVYLPLALDTPSELVMKPMIQEESNLGIAYGRSTNNTIDDPSHFIVSSMLVEAKAAEYTRQCHFSPLISYQTILGSNIVKSNLKDDFVVELLNPLGLGPADLTLSSALGDISAPPTSYGDILAYIYACLSTPIWRSLFAEHICRDYPRIPMATDAIAIQQMVDYGRRLIRIHTNRSTTTIGRYVGNLPATIEYARYSNGRVMINGDCSFDEIPEEVWTFKMGGYNVLSQHLRQLRIREIQMKTSNVLEFCRIAGALEETIDIQAGLDTVMQDILAASYNLDI